MATGRGPIPGNPQPAEALKRRPDLLLLVRRDASRRVVPFRRPLWVKGRRGRRADGYRRSAPSSGNSRCVPALTLRAIRRHTRSLLPTTAIVAGPLRWTAVGHPFGEQINAGLRPWAFAPWRRRHYGATNSTNAVINSSCVSFDFIIARQIEPLYHPLNVSLSKKRANIGLKACGHRASLRD